MDITKLLQSLEEFIYDVACLAVLVPKTLFLLTFFPRRVFQYVNTELQKPAEERFNQYTSPLIQWLLTGLMPHFITLSIMASLPNVRSLLPANPLIDQALRMSMESRLAALCVLALSLPLALAVVTVRERRQELTKASLRSPLYMQCYCLSPQLLAAFPMWFFIEAEQRGVHENITQYDQYLGTPLFIWFIYTSLVLFRLQLNITWKRAFWLLFKSYFVCLAILMVLESCVLIVIHFASEPSV